MRGIVSTRRRADEFEAGVETGTVSSGAPPQTQALVDLVQQIRAVDTIQPREDFTADLRTRLLAAAPEFLTLDELTPAPAPVVVGDRRTTPARRALSAAAAACIVVGGGGAVAAASQTALPGESLYPVKRGIERLEVSTAGSSAGRGQEYLEQAENRLSEIEQLALTQPDDYETPLLMHRALDDFSTAAKDGGDSLMTAYREDGSDESIGELRQFTRESSRRLEEMMQMLPGDLHDELVAAAETLSTLDATARQLCPLCSTLGPLELSSALTILREPLGQLTYGPVVQPSSSPQVDPSGHAQPNQPNAPGSTEPGSQGLHLPSATADPDVTAAVAPSEAAPSAPVTATAAPAPPPTTSGTAPEVTAPLPKPAAGSNDLPGPSVPSVNVKDPLSTVPEVLDPTGDAHDPTGDAHDPTGDAHDPTGDVLDPTGDAHDPTGDVLDPTGDVLDPTGDVLDPTGDVLDPTGDVLDPTGDVLDPTGDVLDPTGDVLDPLVDPLDPLVDPLLP